jgi:hypothetical protein
MTTTKKISFWGYAALYYICLHVMALFINLLFGIILREYVIFDFGIMTAVSIPCSLFALQMVDKLLFKRHSQHIQRPFLKKLLRKTIYLQSIIIIIISIPLSVVLASSHFIVFEICILLSLLVFTNAFLALVMYLSFYIFNKSTIKKDKAS